MSKIAIHRGPQGTHFYSRSNGLNVLVDDPAPPPETWSSAPKYVSIALLNACDLSCYFCYAPKHAARLPAQDVIRWIGELDQAGCLGVGFGGGEPTLHPDFTQIVTAAHESTSLGVSVTTHGHRFSAQLTDQLQGALDFVRISMDGVGSTYESIRGRPFATLIAQIELISRAFSTGINFVLNTRTIDDLPEALRLAQNLGAQELLILPEHRDGILQVSSEVMIRTRQVIREWEGRGLRLAIASGGAEALGLPVLPIRSADHLRDYAHIDASAIVRETSYGGGESIRVTGGSIVESIQELRTKAGEKS